MNNSTQTVLTLAHGISTIPLTILTHPAEIAAHDQFISRVAGVSSNRSFNKHSQVSVNGSIFYSKNFTSAP